MMRAFQGPVWAVLSLFLVTTLAGCHGLDTDGNGTAADAAMDDETDDTTDVTNDQSEDDSAVNEADDTSDDAGTAADPAPSPPEFVLSVNDAPGEVMANESINLTVDITGDSGTADTAEIAFGSTSTAATDDEDLSPAAFNGTMAGDPATLSVPGSYAIVDWRVASAGTVYFRAHIVVDGAHHWSNEYSITITERPAVEAVAGTAADHTVLIPDATSPLTSFSFDPASITVAAGETVKWDSNDGTPHTATHTPESGDPLWDSGNIEANGETGVYLFNKVGTYAYTCTYHEGMDGTIVVE